MTGALLPVRSRWPATPRGVQGRFANSLPSGTALARIRSRASFERRSGNSVLRHYFLSGIQSPRLTRTLCPRSSFNDTRAALPSPTGSFSAVFPRRRCSLSCAEASSQFIAMLAMIALSNGARNAVGCDRSRRERREQEIYFELSWILLETEVTPSVPRSIETALSASSRVLTFPRRVTTPAPAPSREFVGHDLLLSPE
jgi:hypothetical protein